MSNKLPNLFLIGAPKAGTTAVAKNLIQSEHVFLPKIKEPRYFDAKIFYDFEEDYPIKSLDQYLKLYDEAEGFKYRMDASVFNMYSEESLNEILKLNPKARFILILRDPVEASVSMHKQRLKYIDPKMRELSTSFIECWSLIEDRKHGKSYPYGCRNKFLFRYDLLYQYEFYIGFIEKIVPKNQLLIMFYEDLIYDTQEFYKRIIAFLGLKSFVINNRRFNESKVMPSSLAIRSIYYAARKAYPLFKILDKNKILSSIFHNMFFIKAKNAGVDSSVQDSIIQSFDQTRNLLSSLKKKYD